MIQGWGHFSESAGIGIWEVRSPFVGFVLAGICFGDVGVMESGTPGISRGSEWLLKDLNIWGANRICLETNFKLDDNVIPLDGQLLERKTLPVASLPRAWPDVCFAGRGLTQPSMVECLQYLG